MIINTQNLENRWKSVTYFGVVLYKNPTVIVKGLSGDHSLLNYICPSFVIAPFRPFFNLHKMLPKNTIMKSKIFYKPTIFGKGKSFSDNLWLQKRFQIGIQWTNVDFLLTLFSFFLSTYSHLSNKRGVTLIDFEKKFHPPRLLIS